MGKDGNVPYDAHDGNWWDVAQICLNGHTVTFVLIQSPERSQNYCHECGAPTITACPSCQTPIRGYFHRQDIVILDFEYRPPNYCYECGQMLPWAVTKLDAARELADELILSDQEKQTIRERLPDIVRNTSTAEASAFKLKRLLEKAEKAGSVAVGVVRGLIVDIASETAKKIITGP